MKKICSSPWNTVFIKQTGEVFSCLCGEWTNDKVIGNILHNSLEEIYRNSKPLIELKESIIDSSYRFCNSNFCPYIHDLDYSGIGVHIQDIKEISLPTKIMLSIDYNCNLKCASCRPASIFSKSIDPISWKILTSVKQSYKEFNQTCEIFCDGAGDVFTSLAYQKFLFEDSLPECFKLNITTNGNLIKKRIKNILSIKPNINSFIVSLDAANSNTYSEIRGGDFQSLIAGLNLLKENNIEVYTQFVLQYKNYKELLEYKQLANSLKIPYGVQLISRWGHMSDQYWEQNRIEDNPNVDYKQLFEQLSILLQDSSCNFNGGVYTLYNNLKKIF